MARLLLTLLLVAACGRARPAGSPDAAPTVDAAALPDAAPAPLSFEQRKQRLQVLLGSARLQIGKGDLDAATRLVDEASAAAGDEELFVNAVTADRAMVLAYRQDFGAAAKLLAAREAQLGPASRFHFIFQNTLVMLHTAEGDLDAALAACDAMTAAGQRPPWSDDADGRTFVALKEHWHRAYLLRMLAAASQGAKRASALRDAEAARAAYRKLATPLGTHGDSIAVLDGFFAVHAGDRRAALAAAKKVDLAGNGDVEDLYLTQMAFEAGGDAKGADSVRQRIAGLHEISIADAVTRVWLARDQAKPERRSPRHPGAPLP
jgi:hypothetical protein